MSIPKIFMDVVQICSRFATRRAMRMAMPKFRRRRVTYFQDFHVKGQVNAGQRVIGIQKHFISFDCHHLDDRCEVVLAGLKLISDMKLAFHR
jgi:hypothetical protein